MSSFFNQYPLLVPFISILLAEVVKAMVDKLRKRAKIRFINPGGMPSGHSAFVSALVVAVATREGVDSTLFMISAVLALIVMYDAVNVRNQIGLQAKAINKIDRKAGLEESLGHNLWEVIAGACFGALVAFFLLNV